MMIIRKAELKDVEEIVKLHITTWKISYRGYIPDEILDSEWLNFSQKRVDKMSIPIQKGLFFVLEEEGNILGFIGLDDLPKTKTEIKVFYVLPQKQRAGIGTQLFDYVKIYLKEQGCQEINLFTLENYPPSNLFYQKNGGRLTGEVQDLKWGSKALEYLFRL